MRENDASLVESFEVAGVWWDPKSPELKVHGRLAFDPHKGVVVELDGRLGDLGFGEHHTWPVVSGETRNGVACTLVMAAEASTSVGPNMQTSRISAEYCLLGVCFDTPGEIRAVSCVANYSNLTSWLGRRPFDRSFVSSSAAVRNYSVKFEFPPDIRFSLAKQGFGLAFGPWFSSGGATFHEVDMRYGESAVIRPKGKRPLRWFLERLFELQRLLALLMAEPVRLEKLRVRYGSHLDRKRSKMIPDYASLLFRQPYDDSPIRRLATFQMPFHFEAICDVFPEVLQNWFARYEELKSVLDLFFLPLYNQRLNIEFQFLGLLQALEALHRLSIGGRYMSVSEYAVVQTRLVSSIPRTVSADHRAALQSRIRYGYEYSLRKRLTQMTGLLSTETLLSITGGEAPAKFIARVVDTRNYLTHHDEELKEKSLDPVGMFMASQSLRLLLMLLTLREVRIPEETSLARLGDADLLRFPQFAGREGLP
jgi:hypothetical protein